MERTHEEATEAIHAGGEGRQLCDEVGLQPTVFYRQKEFFVNGAAAFEQKTRPRTPLSLEDSRCLLEGYLSRPSRNSSMFLRTSASLV